MLLTQTSHVPMDIALNLDDCRAKSGLWERRERVCPQSKAMMSERCAASRFFLWQWRVERRPASRRYVNITDHSIMAFLAVPRTALSNVYIMRWVIAEDGAHINLECVFFQKKGFARVLFFPTFTWAVPSVGGDSSRRCYLKTIWRSRAAKRERALLHT